MAVLAENIFSALKILMYIKLSFGTAIEIILWAIGI